ncbi:hypothetical protein CsatA_022061 [Cannabis sativa]
MIINNLDDLGASSSISLDEKKYDVFISFRGEDTRCNFTSHLYNALEENEIETYIDYRLERGEEISKALTDAIDQSKICVVVFSQNYASSRWCLDELVHICKCMEKGILDVLPVFYHVDPSDVRNQKRSYETAFSKNEGRFPQDKIKKWRVALATAANHSGWDASKFRDDADLVKDIVKTIRGKMGKKTDPDFDRLLEELETKSLPLAEVLIDAEHKQMSNPGVEKWLDKLRDAVEDAEYLLEELKYDALKLKVEKEPKLKSTIQERKKDMKKILEKLDTFKNDKFILDLQTNAEKIPLQRPPSTFSINDSEFFGRDDEKEILKEMLLSNEVDGEKICVIPIMGMGGIGKTTLAQALYNDDEVNNHFELKAWVCVSDEFDVCKITKTILVAVTRKACDIENLSVLQEKIQKELDENKFLIVLDDLWSEDYDFWDTLRMFFNVGAQGSKIIVTTRSEKVASIVGTTASHHLNVLSKEACFKLFFKIVSGNKEFTTTDSNLGRIVQELVRKCSGLPLAVKAIASLLRVTKVKEWRRIAKSDILDLPVGEKNIIPALRLSYHYLPLHLKRCFVYCSLFPKDYEFKKEELVLLWMVDDLLKHSSGNRTMKEVGYEYFEDLVSRSFFQPAIASRSYSTDCFVMHDIMVDLALFVSRKKFIYTEKDPMYDIGLMKKIRHIAFEVDINCNAFHETCQLIFEANCLRTFMPVTKRYYHSYSNKLLQVQDVMKDLMKLRRLRFLSLARYENVSELPNSVGDLIHLRHLDLSWTSIKELPESVSLLYNLQTLKLIRCLQLSKFPTNLHHLINLRYLYMSRCKFSTLPPLGELPALLTLSIEDCATVEVVGVDFYGTSSSRSFPLLESLTFKHMRNWKEWSAPKPNMEVFPKLTSLTMSSCDSLTGDLPRLLPSLTEFRIDYCPKLASLLPDMPNVTSLRVEECDMIPGLKSCNGLQNFDYLESLHLDHCQNLEFLPSSVYESLQELLVVRISSSSFKLLSLDYFPNIRNAFVHGCENLESFTLLYSLNSLSSLCIENCPNFTLLPDSNLYCPVLTKLFFNCCNKLKFLPEKLSSLLPSLQVLDIDGCPELESLPKLGLPLSLRELTIRNCKTLIASRKNWNLRALPNLTSFSIGGYYTADMEFSLRTWFPIADYYNERMESFPEPGLLPTSLTCLKIWFAHCLKTIDKKGFRELKSLKELHIYRCPELWSLPVKGLPPSFEGSLPPSFETFFMDGCPYLEEKYEWEGNGDLKKIRCIAQP